jgi:hypothetical protein
MTFVPLSSPHFKVFSQVHPGSEIDPDFMKAIADAGHAGTVAEVGAEQK